MALIDELATEERLQRLNADLRKLDEADEVIRRMEQANIDATEQKRRAQANREAIQKIKRAFFPGK